MMKTTTPRCVALVLLLLLVHLSLVHCRSLGQLDHPDEGVNARLTEAGKRDGRRITRGRYRMGYMFGKRSELEGSTASLLVKNLIGKAMPVDDLTRAVQSDATLAERVARHLDKNGDGYVAVGELL